MQVQPEAAVKLEDGARAGGGFLRAHWQRRGTLLRRGTLREGRLRSEGPDHQENWPER